ncbi:23S rRNA (pseudouridine(1915)-N(3))-methyltransferase RlmH [Peptoniphilus sp. GNH]|nr:23S rRNA (pseudouridine(1915)-N(3))-methyltransferase RlmH [Peptoniphilus sp. GNH]
MKIIIICVGKIKDQYIKDGIEEFKKRLTPYSELEVVEVADEPCPENYSTLQELEVRAKEADRILEKLSKDSYVMALDIRGKKYNSVEFAKKIKAIQLGGKSSIDFIIGGSTGLHEKINQKANSDISFSDMTFPHGLMRLILVEQIYRAFRIINNHPYHK